MTNHSVRAAFETQIFLKQIRELKSQVSLGYEVPAVMRDAMSARSVEIMEHFGPDVPAKLNDYACLLEDAFMKTSDNLKAAREKHQLLLDEVEKLRELVNSQDAQVLSYSSLLAMINRDSKVSYHLLVSGVPGALPKQT